MIRSVTAQFPKQRVSESEKSTLTWTKDCVDYIIGSAASGSRSNIQSFFDVLQGNISQDDYRKMLNPYNSTKEEFTRFPATLRNLDITSDVVRRYIGEYIKAPHDFLITATNPDIVMKKESDIRNIIVGEAQRRFAAEFEAAIQEQLQQGVDQETAQATVQQEMDFETFVEEAARTHVDEYTKQADDLLQVLDNYCDATTNVPVGYMHFITCGECYSYRDIRNGEFFKEWVDPREMYPISNGEVYVEDHDMVVRRMSMSYNQVLDNWGDDLTNEQLVILEKLYSIADTSPRANRNADAYSMLYAFYNNDKPDRNLFDQSVASYQQNNNNLDVWHVCWKSWVRVGKVSYVDASTGFLTERIVGEDYIKEPNDIDVEWFWKLNAREAYRIGDGNTGIYFNSRPLLVDRGGKLPYNGMIELLPNMGKFSVVGIMKPFQIMRNIFAYHREMVIAKTRNAITIIPVSLLGSDEEEQERSLYRIDSNGTFIYDDSQDSNSLKAQQIRNLTTSANSYIKDLTDLMEITKQEARELVDMTAQRYGSIATSAGKGTTEEAIIRGSMGSVIVVDRFDKLRELDYNADLDYTKTAWVDGFDYSFFNKDNNQLINFQLNVENHNFAKYLIKVKNSSIEAEKLQQLKDWAFSAAQNGDMSMALAAINSNSVPQLTRLVERFEAIKKENEANMKQLEADLAKQEIDNQLQLIEAKGVQDRLTEELKASLQANDNYDDTKANDVINKLRMDEQKLDLERDKLRSDNFNKQKDRELDYKIAKIKATTKPKSTN